MPGLSGHHPLALSLFVDVFAILPVFAEKSSAVRYRTLSPERHSDQVVLRDTANATMRLGSDRSETCFEER